MNKTLRRRFNLFIELPKVAVILIAYLPDTWQENLCDCPHDHRLAAGVGLYLLVSILLRSQALCRGYNRWLLSGWVLLDTTLAMVAWGASGWQMRSAYVGLLMAGEAAMVGYPLWRGLAHFAVATLIVAFAPLPGLGMEQWLDGWVTPMVPGLLFVYTFISLGEEMSREKEAAARARTEAELANVQLREYAHQVEALAVLRERNRLARDVHDTIAHRFTGILMQVEAVARLWDKDPATAAGALGAVREQVRESLNEVRRSVHALRPPQLEGEQGTVGIARLVEEFKATTGVNCELLIAGLPRELPAAHELCLYRAAQEGLTNAFRHGRASRVRVRLGFDPEQTVLTVEDDGQGAPGPEPGGLGIVGIRERAEVLGGTVEAGTARTGGFVLRVALPAGSVQSGGVA